MVSMIPRATVTPDNLGPIVSIITWILLVCMILSVCAKVAMKLLVSRRFSRDDGAILLAMAGYSSNILYVASLAVSKLSILFLLQEITPVSRLKKLAFGLGIFILIWTIITIVASIFECSLPHPWKILGSQCFDQISFWTYYGVVNIATEMGLILLPTYTLWNVHIAAKQKFSLIMCFVARIVVVGATIAQLVKLNQLRNSEDITFDSWAYCLCSQFVQNLSVITVCIPYIKNALIGMETGMLQTGDFRRRGPGHPSTTKNKSNPSSGSSRPHTTVNSQQDNRSAQRPSIELNDLADRNPFSANNTAVVKPSAASVSWDEESQSSRAGIITKTTEWRVDEERVTGPENMM